MGRGLAKSVASFDPTIPRILGRKIMMHGNSVLDLKRYGDVALLSFPVKPVDMYYDANNVVEHKRDSFEDGDIVPGWACKASPDIIRRSAEQLFAICRTSFPNIPVYLPMPGCGAGELSWAQVKPILEEYLDDQFVVCSFNITDFNTEA